MVGLLEAEGAGLSATTGSKSSPCLSFRVVGLGRTEVCSNEAGIGFLFLESDERKKALLTSTV